MGAWEMLVHELAERAKISTSPAQLERFNRDHHTFLTKRFDRLTGGRRLHFASAMMLLQSSDGDGVAEGASYLELARLIMQEGARAEADLAELWTRIVFNMCVSNVDDHLRNHGFLLEAGGWALAPAYDMNPNPLGDGLKLNVSETDNAQDLGLALAVAPHFRLTPADAKERLSHVVATVRAWRVVAK